MIWKVYPSDSRYEVSDMGLVRMIGRSNDRKPSVNPVNGYHIIVFSIPGSKHVGRYVHRMVMETFIGPCPEGMEVSHLNGKAGDNRLANLTYESKKANHARKVSHQTDYGGQRNPAAKLTPEQVSEIRKSNLSETQLEKIYPVTRATIGRIRRGDAWKLPK